MKHLRNTAVFIALAATLCAQLVMTTFNKTVATGGTPVTLAASSTPFVSGTVQALSSNTGKVCVGGPTVLVSTNTGTCLTAGLAAPLYAVAGVAHDLHNIWVDSAVNGEGVSITYEH